MPLYQELSQSRPEKDVVFAIGVFDGVHRGHQHLMSIVRDEAKRRGSLSGAITFANHPRNVLLPDNPILLINDISDRIKLLRDHVDFVVPLTFDIDLSRTRAKEFCRNLVDSVKMKDKVVAIHQPNFFPWIGYFEKMARADSFIFMDNVQFPKKGGAWCNRVKLLIGGEARWVTASIDRNFSKTREIREMNFLSDNPWRQKIVKSLNKKGLEKRGRPDLRKGKPIEGKSTFLLNSALWRFEEKGKWEKYFFFSNLPIFFAGALRAPGGRTPIEEKSGR